MEEQDLNAANSPSEELSDQKIEEPVLAVENRKSSGLTRRNLLKGATVGGAVAVATGATVGGITILGPKIAASGSNASATGRVREYWIQADSLYHNLVPTGYDGLMGMRYTANQTSFWAVGYRAYTANWGKLLASNSDIGSNTGIPGPILRGSVGDTIRVHFRNNDTHRGYAHSMHPHGVSYTPANDGAWFAADPRSGTMILVGRSYTYEWQVRSNSVGTWVYHDHSSPQMVQTSGGEDGDNGDSDGGSSDGDSDSMLMEFGSTLGLFGFLVLTDASVQPVDREFFTFLHDIYQSDVPELSQDFDCFNGNSFVGNTATLNARVGDRVRWHIGSLGTEFHVFHIHGHRWTYNGQFTDTVMLGPSVATSFEFTEDNPGNWLYHCHVSDHMMGGMSGLYVVTD